MLKYSLYTILYIAKQYGLEQTDTINKKGFQKNASKIDDITFCGKAHNQQGFRK